MFCHSLWPLEFLGNGLVPWGSVIIIQVIAETLSIRSHFLTYEFHSFLAVGFAVLAKERYTLNQIVTISWKGGKRNVFETSKERPSTSLVEGLFLLLLFKVSIC